jgi:hypothetical protein
MVQKFPIDPDRRRHLEAAIRIIDIIIYFAVLVGGCYALWSTPTSVATELAGWEWLVPIWAGFLLIGGGLGVVGRVTRIWVLEPPADVAAIIGIIIYFIILGKTLTTSVTAAVAAALVFCAMLLMLRRYVELQIFGTDPDNKEFSDRIAEMLRRRTTNVAPREE